MLSAMAILLLSKTQIGSIYVVQRKMLRRIIGWHRIHDEPWHDTVTRRRERVSRAMDLHHIDKWNLSIWRARLRFAYHVALSKDNA